MKMKRERDGENELDWTLVEKEYLNSFDFYLNKRKVLLDVYSPMSLIQCFICLPVSDSGVQTAPGCGEARMCRDIEEYTNG